MKLTVTVPVMIPIKGVKMATQGWLVPSLQSAVYPTVLTVLLESGTGRQLWLSFS